MGIDSSALVQLVEFLSRTVTSRLFKFQIKKPNFHLRTWVPVAQKKKKKKKKGTGV